jgi:hypothetical protein
MSDIAGGGSSHEADMGDMACMPPAYHCLGTTLKSTIMTIVMNNGIFRPGKMTRGRLALRGNGIDICAIEA